MSNQLLCSKCPRPAWFDFSAGIFLCEHCTNIVLMRARIDSLKGSAEAFSAGSAVADVNARTGASAAAANSVSPNSRGDDAAALTLAGSQGLGGTAAVISESLGDGGTVGRTGNAVADAVNGTATPGMGVTAGRDRQPISNPSDGRDSSDVKPAASVPSAPEGAAGNSFDDGIPSIFLRGHPDCIVKNNSAFRVAANSGSQVSASSSFISPNHHQ